MNKMMLEAYVQELLNLSNLKPRKEPKPKISPISIQQAINILRPELPARDALCAALQELIADPNSYFATVGTNVISLVQNYLPRLRKTATDMIQTISRVQQLRQDFLDKFLLDCTHWGGQFIDLQKIGEAYPELKFENNDDVLIKIINGQMYVEKLYYVASWQYAGNNMMLHYSKFLNDEYLLYKVPQDSSRRELLQPDVIHRLSKDKGQMRLDNDMYNCQYVLPCGLVYKKVGTHPNIETFLTDFQTNRSIQVKPIPQYVSWQYVNNRGEVTTYCQYVDDCCEVTTTDNVSVLWSEYVSRFYAIHIRSKLRNNR